MNNSNILRYSKVQIIAKSVMKEIRKFLKPGISEKEIVDFAERQMLKKGVDSFWYHNIGALVYVGKRTNLSLSGKIYKPTNTKIKDNDLITVDLSPQLNNYWGDYARSIEFVNGKIKETIGNQIEKKLHKYLLKIAKSNMTFGELYDMINIKINILGYKNLDFLNNLGHSIETDIDKRKYIEKGDKTVLKSKIFTFEPHISIGKYGYKHEDIYYFDKSKLIKL